MAKIKAVGIDLGTTNSAVAWVNESGRTAMVRNAEGDILTPSVVLFDDTEVIVGKEAASAATVKPDRVAQWVKRDMGAPVYSRPIRGEYLPPEVIQACILRKLRADTIRALGGEIAVVITVPAYFDEPRRKATADAGEMAGLNVLDIVNEPTAAALGFSEITGYLNGPTGPQQQIHVMVYDLGGGTFDVTMLRLAPGDIRTLATDGDVHLGGHDWDMRLVDYVAGAFKQLYHLDPRDDPAAFHRLYSTIVEAKHTLSARNRTTIRVDHNGCAGEITVTREQFEQLTADLLERTSYTSRQLLSAAKLQWSEVGRILLVGGSTRMPMVPRMLLQLTGIEPDRTVNPDEAVARGAALYANHLLQERGEGAQRPAFQVTNVNAHSLGIEGIDAGTLRKTNVVLIPRNTPLPAKFKETFVTKTDGQRSIVIQVLEGESSLPGECTAIGRTVIRDLPPGLPKGWPVEVTFEYGTNGRLTVRGVVPGTQREALLEVERDTGLTPQGLSGWKQVVTSHGGFGGYGALVDDGLRAHGQASQATAVSRPDVQPKVSGTMEAIASAPVQQGRQYCPIPSREGWGPGYQYAGNPAAPAAQPPPAASPPLPPPTSAVSLSAPPASTACTGGLSAAQGEAVEARASRPGTPTSKWVKTAINVGGYIVFSLLGLIAGYLVVRSLYPDFGFPWLW